MCFHVCGTTSKMDARAMYKSGEDTIFEVWRDQTRLEQSRMFTSLPKTQEQLHRISSVTKFTRAPKHLRSESTSVEDGLDMYQAVVSRGQHGLCVYPSCYPEASCSIPAHRHRASNCGNCFWMVPIPFSSLLSSHALLAAASAQRGGSVRFLQ